VKLLVTCTTRNSSRFLAAASHPGAQEAPPDEAVVHAHQESGPVACDPQWQHNSLWCSQKVVCELIEWVIGHADWTLIQGGRRGAGRRGGQEGVEGVHCTGGTCMHSREQYSKAMLA
jgi:hypothetical protein